MLVLAALIVEVVQLVRDFGTPLEGQPTPLVLLCQGDLQLLLCYVRAADVRLERDFGTVEFTHTSARRSAQPYYWYHPTTTIQKTILGTLYSLRSGPAHCIYPSN
jgi:hypothetical protein